MIDRLLRGRPSVEFKVRWKYLEHKVHEEKRAFSVFLWNSFSSHRNVLCSLHSVTGFASSYCKYSQSHFFNDTFLL